jgi:hypothetical protein
MQASEHNEVESQLLAYVRQLERNYFDWRAVHLHLSCLKPHNRREKPGLSLSRPVPFCQDLRLFFSRCSGLLSRPIPPRATELGGKSGGNAGCLASASTSRCSAFARCNRFAAARTAASVLAASSSAPRRGRPSRGGRGRSWRNRKGVASRGA